MKAHPVGEEAVEAAFDAGVKPARPRQEREDHRRTVRLMLEAANDPLRAQHFKEFSALALSNEAHEAAIDAMVRKTGQASDRGTEAMLLAVLSKVSEGLEQ